MSGYEAQESHYDLLVIGGGSGGVATARRAAKHNARVLLIEGGAIGGTCVNVGCVPKKVLWNAASIREALTLSEDYGLGRHPLELDYARLKTARDAYIARLNAIYDKNLAAASVTRVQGWAKFVDQKTVSVAGPSGLTKHYSAKHILIATGAKPRLPDVRGRELLETSDDFFTWDKIPKKVAVVGAGYIAVELAGVLHALGSEVTILIRGDRVLRKFDAELAQRLMTLMQGHGIEIRTGVVLDSISRNPDGLAMKTESGVIGGFDKILAAIGRDPHADINLASAGVDRNKSGHILVDDYQNTTQSGIYAVGDVTGKVELTPVAIAAGRHLAERLFNGKTSSKLDYENVASVVFSHPPLASVGLSEEEATKQYGVDGVQVYRSNFVNMYYALGQDKPQTIMKIVTRRSDERILGMHVLGMGADEMIQGFAVAVKMGATKRDLDATIAIHPTASEEFVTM